MPTIGGVNGIGFDPATPADTESAGLGDDRIRSVKTSVQQVFDAEHNFPSGGGNAIGYHVMGACRPFYGPQSAVSSTGSDARTMIASDTSRYFAVGSAGTTLLGAGPLALSVGSMVGISFPQRHYLAEEIGFGITASSGTTLVTFPNSGYSGAPVVWTTLMNQGLLLTAFKIVSTETPTPTGAVVWALDAGTGSIASGVQFMWRSLGSRVL